MANLSKRNIHSYVKDWLNDYDPNTNDWEKCVYDEIVRYAAENELYGDMGDTSQKYEKIKELVRIDPLYVKKYKQWFEQNALKRIQTDF